jgi:hypothetical protein
MIFLGEMVFTLLVEEVEEVVIEGESSKESSMLCADTVCFGFINNLLVVNLLVLVGVVVEEVE